MWRFHQKKKGKKKTNVKVENVCVTNKEVSTVRSTDEISTVQKTLM